MQKREYLAVYEAWLRRGQPGRAPSPLKYGLTTGDVTTDLCEVESKLIPAGMNSWRYYDPEYHQPLLAIRRIADLLGIDVDEAAAEWHAWNERFRDKPEKLTQLLSDYLHAEHEAREDCSKSIFQNSREHKRGQRYPRIPNPHLKKSASALLARRRPR
jgi:hypothetical protein